jgi:hypothetical protein
MRGLEGVNGLVSYAPAPPLHSPAAGLPPLRPNTRGRKPAQALDKPRSHNSLLNGLR